MQWTPRILLIEDNFADVKVLEAALKQNGFAGQLTVRNNVSEALSFITGAGMFSDRTAHPLPHIILLDWVLPDGTGLEVLKTLRSTPATRRIPTIILSVVDSRESINSAYHLNANSYFIKRPTREAAEELIGHIREYWTTAMLPGEVTFN